MDYRTMVFVINQFLKFGHHGFRIPSIRFAITVRELNVQGQSSRIKADKYQQVQKIKNERIPCHHHQLGYIGQMEDSKK